MPHNECAEGTTPRLKNELDGTATMSIMGGKILAFNLAVGSLFVGLLFASLNCYGWADGDCFLGTFVSWSSISALVANAVGSALFAHSRGLGPGPGAMLVSGATLGSYGYAAIAIFLSREYAFQGEDALAAGLVLWGGGAWVLTVHLLLFVRLLPKGTV